MRAAMNKGLAVVSATNVRATIRIAASGPGGHYREGLASCHQTLLGLEFDPSYFWLRIAPAPSVVRSFVVLHSGPPVSSLASRHAARPGIVQIPFRNGSSN